MTARADAPDADVAPHAWAPTRYERIPALASQVIGGPVGRFAVVGRRGLGPAVAVLSALSSVWIALSVLQRNHCVSKGWSTPGALWRYCYSDIPVAVSVPAGGHPWANPAFGTQPPLTAVITWAVRALVPAGNQLRLQQTMFAISAVLIALLIAAAVCFLAAASRQTPWTAAHLALSPVLFTTALTSFDALAVTFTAAALWAHAKRHPAVAGALATAAALTRPALGVVLVALLLIYANHPHTTERTQRVRPQAGSTSAGQRKTQLVAQQFVAGHALVPALASSVGLTAVVLAIMALLADNPLAVLDAWRSQGANYGSGWFLITLAGSHLSPDSLTIVALLGWAAAITIGLVLVRLERFSRPAPVALAMLVIVVLTSRAVPVQAALWVLPLLAACAIPWRDHLLWAGVEFAYFLVVWPFVARSSNPAKALPDGWYVAVTLARLATWALLAAFVIRRELSTDSSRTVVAGSLDRSTTPFSTPNV